MVKFTKTAVLQALEEIVAEVGENYVYPGWETGCMYADEGDGEPACIVGRVIAKIDPNMFEETRKAELSRGGSWSISGFHETEEERDEALSSVQRSVYGKVSDIPPVLETDDANTRDILRVAQIMQDGGETYAWALNEAKRKAEDPYYIAERS